MVRFEKFHAEDMLLLAPQDRQVDEVAIVNMGLGPYLERELSFTGWVGIEPVICSGILPLTDHRGLVWAYVASDAGAHMLELTRFARRIFDGYPGRRLEANILPGFEQGRRWISMLGFTFEATVECYDELGRTVEMHKRMRA